MVLMAPKAESKARARAKAKSKATRIRQLAAGNRRQNSRRDAVRALNNVATELGVASARVPSKIILANEPKVERLVRLLETRCRSAELQSRLREAQFVLLCCSADRLCDYQRIGTRTLEPCINLLVHSLCFNYYADLQLGCATIRELAIRI